MEYHFHPPFFEVTPHPTLGNAWESFCCDILNLDNKTTEIRRRTPPDLGVDLFWQSKRRAYQCKSVESGQAGDFDLASAIDSMERAIKSRKAIGWDHYVICSNIDLTGTQEARLRKVFPGVEFLTPAYWRPCCRRYHDAIASRFRLLVRVSEPAIVQSIDGKFLDSYADSLKASLKGSPLTLLVYSNRREDIFEVPASADFTADDLLEVLISLFSLPNRRTYAGLDITVSLSYALVINEKKVPLDARLRDLGLSNRSVVTLWKTIVWSDERGQTTSTTIEMVTMKSITTRAAGPRERAETAMTQFKKEIDSAFETAIRKLSPDDFVTHDENNSQAVAAAYHEAAHVVALRFAGKRALSMCVNADGSGATTPDELPSGESLIQVALAGIMARTLHSHVTDLTTFIHTYVTADADRNLIVKGFHQPWLAHGSTGVWHHAQYDRAQKFNEIHQKPIAALAQAILAKTTFPKCLTEAEIDAVLRE